MKGLTIVESGQDVWVDDDDKCKIRVFLTSAKMISSDWEEEAVMFRDEPDARIEEDLMQRLRKWTIWEAAKVPGGRNPCLVP